MISCWHLNPTYFVCKGSQRNTFGYRTRTREHYIPIGCYCCRRILGWFEIICYINNYIFTRDIIFQEWYFQKLLNDVFIKCIQFLLANIRTVTCPSWGHVVILLAVYLRFVTIDRNINFIGTKAILREWELCVKCMRLLRSILCIWLNHVKKRFIFKPYVQAFNHMSYGLSLLLYPTRQLYSSNGFWAGAPQQNASAWWINQLWQRYVVSLTAAVVIGSVNDSPFFSAAYMRL